MQMSIQWTYLALRTTRCLRDTGCWPWPRWLAVFVGKRDPLIWSKKDSYWASCPWNPSLAIEALLVAFCASSVVVPRLPAVNGLKWNVSRIRETYLVFRITRRLRRIGCLAWPRRTVVSFEDSSAWGDRYPWFVSWASGRSGFIKDLLAMFGASAADALSLIQQFVKPSWCWVGALRVLMLLSFQAHGSCA